MSWKTFMLEQMVSSSRAAGAPYNYMSKNCYAELEMIEEISLDYLLLKMKKEAKLKGNYSDMKRINKLDVIERNSRLKELFTNIVESKYKHYVEGEFYEYRTITR